MHFALRARPAFAGRLSANSFLARARQSRFCQDDFPDSSRLRLRRDALRNFQWHTVNKPIHRLVRGRRMNEIGRTDPLPGSESVVVSRDVGITPMYMKRFTPTLVAALVAAAPLIGAANDTGSNSPAERTASLLQSGRDVRLNQVSVGVGVGVEPRPYYYDNDYYRYHHHP